MVWLLGIGIFLVLLFVFPRQMGTLLLGIVVLIALGGAYIWQQGEGRKRARASVEVSVRYDVSACSSSFPLLVTYRNGSRRTVEKIIYDIGGFTPGYSDVVLQDDYKTDRIIPPGQTYGECWSVPRAYFGASEARVTALTLAPASAQWRITSRYVTFQSD